MRGCPETCRFCLERVGGAARPWMTDQLPPSVPCMFVYGRGGVSRPQTPLCSSLSSSVTTVISPLASLLFQMLEEKPAADLKCARTSQLTQNLASAAGAATSRLFLVFVPPRQPACFCACHRKRSSPVCPSCFPICFLLSSSSCRPH